MTPMVAEALTVDFSKITEAITSNAQAALLVLLLWLQFLV